MNHPGWIQDLITDQVNKALKIEMVIQKFPFLEYL